MLLGFISAVSVAAVPLPEGYSMKVFGEQESQQESNEALAEYMPLTLVLILIVLLLLILAIAIALGVVEIIELVYLNRSAKLFE